MLAVVLGAAVMSLAGGIARAASSQVVPPAGKRLLVVGDSVLAGVPAAGAVPQLQAALPGWAVTFDAKECRSIEGARKACGNQPGTVDGGLEAIEAHGADFDAVVVQLGTNDAADPASALTTAGAAKAILDRLKTVPHVYWLTIREAGHYAAGYTAFNSLLRQLPDTYPNLTVVDWAAATKGRSELFGPDGLHLDNAGAAYAVTVIAGAVNGKLDAAVPTVTAPSPASSAPSTSAAGGAPASADTAGTAAVAGTAKASSSSSGGGTTNIVIGVVVALALLVGIFVAVLAGRRRERRHKREERSARVEAELARSAGGHAASPDAPREEPAPPEA